MKSTKRDLSGGSDGSFGSSGIGTGGNAGKAISGEDSCIEYVGGPMRGKSDNTLLLELFTVVLLF